jgi:hypothetical protein
MLLLMQSNTVKSYSFIPEFPGLPEVKHTNSSYPGPRVGVVDLSEGCMITGVVKYTHELAHFVNAVRDPDRRDLGDIVSRLFTWK